MVVWVGATVADPEVGKVPLPTEGLMLTLAASLVQVSVALWPAVIVVADACSVTDGCAPGGLVEAELPPHPASEIIMEKQKQHRIATSKRRFRPKRPTPERLLQSELEACCRVGVAVESRIFRDYSSGD